MNREREREDVGRSNKGLPSDGWLCAQSLLGKPIPCEETFARNGTSSQRLYAIPQEEQRWISEVSTSAETRTSFAIPAADLSDEQSQWLTSISTLYEINWDPAKHPRLGGPPNAGWFATTGKAQNEHKQRIVRGDDYYDNWIAVNDEPNPRTSTNPGVPANVNADAADAKKYILPGKKRGTWLGTKGESTFRLKKPIYVNGKRVGKIDFNEGLPVLDEFVEAGKSPAIILTGDSKIDIRNAEKEWMNLNPGKRRPPGTFHHDLLHATEEIVEIDGKKTKVLVGKMHLVPESVHAITHQGSASAARRFYRLEGIDDKSIKNFASAKEFAKARSKLVARASKNIIVPTIGLKPSPSGETFRFFSWVARLFGHGTLSSRIA